MGNKISFDYSKATNVIREGEVKSMEAIAEAAKEVLVSGTGAGNDFLGWVRGRAEDYSQPFREESDAFHCKRGRE